MIKCLPSHQLFHYHNGLKPTIWKETECIYQDLLHDKSKYYLKSRNSDENMSLKVIKKYKVLMTECKNMENLERVS